MKYRVLEIDDNDAFPGGYPEVNLHMYNENIVMISKSVFGGEKPQWIFVSLNQAKELHKILGEWLNEKDYETNTAKMGEEYLKSFGLDLSK